jgi:hexosaminidase
LFYGTRVVSMDRVYRLMSDQAQSWSDSWDPMPSKARKPIWGSSYEIFKTPRPADDQTLPLPPAPNHNLEYSSTWSIENARRIKLASQAKQTNDVVLGLLYDNLKRSQFNRYNLEVYVTIADLFRQNSTMIEDVHHMDVDLASASQIKDKDPAKALHEVDSALDTAKSIWQKRNEVLQNATMAWEERWFPRVAEANGRRFLNEMDDVKDHLPNRTIDMTYLVYREKLLPFGEWVNSIATARNQFATAQHLPVRDYHLAWDDFSVNPPWFGMELSSTAATAAAQ